MDEVEDFKNKSFISDLNHVFLELPFILKIDEEEDLFDKGFNYLSENTTLGTSIFSFFNSTPSGNHIGEKFSKITDVDKFFELIFKIECRIYKYINDILKEFDTNKNFIELGENTESIKKCLEILNSVSRILIENTEEILNLYSQYNQELHKKILFIYNKITCCNDIGFLKEIVLQSYSESELEKFNINTMNFLNKIKSFMVISLLKVSQCGVCQERCRM